ncbi:efflux RND transporter permease subunit [bacterium]|nr:MAG: efflux RND transporter permease subunit [bacterium]
MRLARFSIDRPVTTAMFTIAVVLLGLVSLRRLSVDLLPNVSYPKLSVVTQYPGVAPEEMETLVTAPLEAAVSRIPGLQGVESISKEGVSYLTLEFAWGTNMDFALLHTREKLDGARDGLPRDVENPVIIALDPKDRPIMVLAVSGERGLVELKEFCEELLKPRLEQVDGIGSADIAGGVEREIQVELDPRLLSLYGLSVEAVSTRIDAFNRGLQGGTIHKGRFKYALRVSGEFRDVSEIGEINLKTTKDRGVIRLKDVAGVKDSVKEREGLTRLNGRESIGVLIRKESGANTVKVTRAAREIIEGFRGENPEVRIQTVSEQSKSIEEAIATTAGEIVEGAILAFLVLLLFLQEVKTPLIIGIVFPISIIATFNLLFFGNITLNIMSLGGLALGVGMLDDCAVVVSENIFRHRAFGKSMKEAADIGTREVGPAVTAAALTTVVVFLPVIYVHGVAGQLFKDAALTVTFSLMSSLVISLTLLPMLTSRKFGKWGIGRETATGMTGAPPVPGGRPRLRGFVRVMFKGLGSAIRFVMSFLLQLTAYALHLIGLPFMPLLRRIARSFNSGYERFIVVYHRSLVWSLDHKGAVLMPFFIFFAVMTFTGTRIKRELMPKLKTSSFEISLRTPLDYSIEQTADVVSSLETWLAQRPERRLTYSHIGIVSGMEAINPDVSLNSARVFVEAVSPAGVERLIETMRLKFPSFENVGFSIIREQSTLAEFLAFSSAEVELKVRGDDLDRLKQISSDLAGKLETVPGIADINADVGEGKPEFLVKIRDEALADYSDLTPAVVGSFIVDAVRGRVAGSFKEMEKKCDIRVRIEEGSRTDIDMLLNEMVPYKNSSIPLRELVTAEVVRGPREIRRDDQQREFLVTANLRGKKISQVMPAIRKAIDSMALPAGFRILTSGEQEEMAGSFRSLVAAFLLAVLLNYMIMAAQFESLVHPLLILLTIPMGLCGSVLAMGLTGQTMNVISAIGMVVLLGIVVDNAIVKVDCTNRLRKEGAGLREAIVESSHVRLRPILMSTATTLIGLVPMALGIGRGAELLRPLGIVVIGGLAFSTLLTLVLIPVVYEIVEARKEKRKKA